MKRVPLYFWLVIVFGFVVAPLVAVGAGIAKGSPIVPAVTDWIGHLFEPGYNEFLIALINALPFVALGVFLIFHLTGERVPNGRLIGIFGAFCAGAVLDLWGLAAIRLSRSSTASIGYIFLPFEVSVVMPVGYVVGRLIAKTLAKRA